MLIKLKRVYGGKIVILEGQLQCTINIPEIEVIVLTENIRSTVSTQTAIRTLFLLFAKNSYLLLLESSRSAQSSVGI
ncbi:MAG: hypothetical protein L3J75_12820 [Methylococcaceae bacterium]|nr:hypothetical protein [Methylococcaceae bacterium]